MSRQGSRLFGVSVAGDGIVARGADFFRRIPETHWPTLAVGLGTLAVLAGAPRVLPRVPATLIALVVASGAVKLLGLDALAVTTLDVVQGGLPALAWPALPLDRLPLLAA